MFLAARWLHCRRGMCTVIASHVKVCVSNIGSCLGIVLAFPVLKRQLKQSLREIVLFQDKQLNQTEYAIKLHGGLDQSPTIGPALFHDLGVVCEQLCMHRK